MQGFRYDFTNKYSNQYKTITDLSPEEYAFNGYDAGALSRGDMVYDGNGNLTTEPEKGLTIAYNVLNLPAKITRQIDTEYRTIDYLYGGDGTKLQRKTGDESEVTKTDYIGTFVYEDVADQSSLKYLITPAGRLLHDSLGNWQWEYNLGDHLGNTRAVIYPDNDNNIHVKQETHYYPFGLAMVNMGFTPTDNPNQYLYNGKELQNDLDLGWYDYGARFYDPSLGRWHSVDPMAEKYYFISPYNYSLNSPIRFADPDGNSPLDKVFSKTISYTARALWDATLSVTRYVGESTRDILNKTSVKTSAELKFTEEIGMEFNVKGEGGGGASMTFSESSITVENSLSLDKGSETSFETSKNNDIKYKGVGQIGGNGAEFSYTQSEDGTVSSEGKVTTSTSVPLVQTETSFKVDNKGGLEIASGVAAGVKTPIMLTPKFTTIHVSIDLGMKLIYDKNED